MNVEIKLLMQTLKVEPCVAVDLSRRCVGLPPCPSHRPLCVLMLKDRHLQVCKGLRFVCVCVRGNERKCVSYLHVPLLISFMMEKAGTDSGGSEKTNIHLQFYVHSMCHDSGLSAGKIPVCFTQTDTHTHTHSWQMHLLPFNSHARALNLYIV